MFRNDDATAAATLPTPGAPGTPGFYTAGNPATATAATVVTADALNALQEELMTPVLAAGLTPSKTNNGQLLAALQALLGGAPIGQCYLAWLSTSSIVLQPFNGNQIKIAGKYYSIPAAGVAAPAPPGASAFNYLYLWNNAGVLTIEESATGWSFDTTAGNIGTPIKTGDNSRTLIGIAATDAASHYQNMLTASWFNPVSKTARANFTTNRTSSSLTMAEINSEIRIAFVTFATREVELRLLGVVSQSSSAAGTNSSIAIDGTAIDESVGASSGAASSPGALLALMVKKLLTEALHTSTLVGAIGTGGTTSTWLGGSVGTVDITFNYVSIQG